MLGVMVSEDHVLVASLESDDDLEADSEFEGSSSSHTRHCSGTHFKFNK